MAYQDLNQFISECWGWGSESTGLLSLVGLVSNVAIGQNPPYTVQNFIEYHPEFAGCPLAVAGTLDGTSGTILDLSTVYGVVAGQLVTGPGIVEGSVVVTITPGPISITATTVNGNANIIVSSSEDLIDGAPVSGVGIQVGSVILEIVGTTVTLSLPATANGVEVALQVGANPSMVISIPTLKAGTFNLQVYTKPMVPAAVLKAYINLASASIQQKRWCEMWYVAMGLYISHYCILFLRSYAQGPGSTARQVASAGLAIGVQTSKSAGDVSVGMQALQGLEDFGAYQLTIPGQTFATFAKAIGSGGMLLL